MSNVKIPHAERDQWPLLVNGTEIAWICGRRIDHRYRVQSGTQTVARIKFSALPGTAS